MMEAQLNANRKSPLKPNKRSTSSSPIKGTPSTSSTSTTSTSKVLIITPEQIAKLGLTQQLNKVVQSQVSAKLPTTLSKSGTEPEVPRKRNVRVSKITIINPKSSEGGNCDPEKSFKNRATGASDTSVKSEVASLMKNKLSNLMKARETSSTSHIPTSSFNNSDIKSAKDDHHHGAKLEMLGRKRKGENLEISSSKIVKNLDDDDDDVVLVDYPVDVKALPEEHSTKLKKEGSKSVAKSENQTVSVIVKNENRGQNVVGLSQIRTPTNPSEIKTNEIEVRRSKIKLAPNILSAKRVSVQLNAKSSVPAKENKINAEIQEPKEEPFEIPVNFTPHSCEDVKPKIHVLSNEQISLPHTYIESLKFKPDKSSVSHSTPLFISKSSNSSTSNISDVKPVINLVSKENNEKMKIHLKEELHDSEPSDGTIASKSHSLKHEEVLVISELPKTDNEKASVSKSATVNSETIINIENLNRHFIDKDTIILINDSHISNVFSDGENEEVAGNSKNSSHTNVENLIISESDNKPNLSVIDLTESAEDEELQKSSQNFPLMKSGCIKNFATQIKNKLEITDYSTVKKDLKNSSVKKLYSRKSSLSTNLTVVNEHSKENPESSTREKSDLRANPERKSEISQSLKIEVPVKTEPSVKETYNKKCNLFTNVAVNEHTKENPESSTTEKSKSFSTNLELKSEISQSLKMEVPVKTKMSVKETYNRKRNLSTNVAVNEHTKENPESSTIEKSKCLSTDSELESEISHSSKMVPIKTETSVKKPYSRKRSLSANLAVNEHSKQHSESSIAEKSKNLDTNPKSKSEIPQLLKMNIPAKTEPTVIKTYSRKRNLSTNLAINEKSKNLDTNSESKPEFPDLLKTKAAITSNNETNNAEVQNKEDGSITEHQIKAQEETIDIIKPENPESPRTEKSKNLDTNSESKPEFPYLLKTEASITSNNETNNAEVQNKEDSSIREHQIKAQEETIVIIKPAPKKRGRKKKSEMVKTETIEMVKTETIEIQNNLPEREVETSRRGRKRKVVDYFALSEGFDSPDSTEYEANKPKRSTNLSLSESVDEKDEIVEIDTVISCNLNDNSINCTYSAQEISPLPKETPPKRKRGRPPRIKVIDNITSIQEKTSEIDSTSTKKTIENSPSDAEKTNEAHLTDTETSEIGPADVDKTSELSSTNIKKTNDNNTIDTQKTSEVSSSTNETSIIKKKKGRPKAKEPSLTKKIFNTLFDHINTSTALESDKDEAPNETNVGNTELIANTSTIETIIVEPDLIDASVEPQSDKKQRKTKKRGRKRGNFKSVSVEKPSATSSDGSTVTCAVCDKGVTKSNWGNHKLRFHNNLAWKVGDPPLDLNDQKFVMSVLSDIYKRRKPLYCEKCGDSKKSVLGYLSHKSMCQKSTEQVTAMRVKCEFCDRSVLPVSMSAHLKFCKGNESENNVNCEGNNSQEKPEEFLVQGKRQAAKKAHSLIKSLKDDGTIETVEGKSKKTQRWYVNFDFQPTYFGTKRFRTEIIKNGTAKCRFAECKFETSDVDELSNHIYACDKKPTEGYTCKFCIKPFKTENDVLDHLKEAHTSTLKPDETSPYEDYSEGEDFDEDELLDEYNDDGDKIVNKNKPVMYNRANLMHGIKFLLKHRFCAPGTHIAYPPALDWTLKFCKQNFSITNLFPNWRTTLLNWEKLQPRMIANYLPHLKYSACTTMIENKNFVDPLKIDHEWKRYKLFEANMLNNGTSMIFCGGPIFAMAWVPTPYDQKNCNQILAVSANCDIDKGYSFDEKYSESGLIQFWNCGVISNEKVVTEPPKLEFCIAHDYGPIWHLEWCPSGCYDVQPNQEHDYLQRLGVLAIASANSHIYLYSVCSPGQISGKILKPKPVLKLVLDSVLEHSTNDLEAHVTKISWSKASEHQYLVAGYGNGMVAIYYLNTTSTLLQLGMDQNGIQTMMPYRVFNAHHHAVTVLCLYHLNDGRRWLLTGSIDRTIKYWDLENPIVPLTNFTKFIATDGVWLNHWLSTIHCFDDSCAGGLTYTAAHQLRNFESDTASVMHSNSRVSSITGSDWTNGFVQGNVAGEVKGFFPHQMFFAMDGDKSYRNKRVILGYTRLVEKDLSINERVEEEKRKLQRIYSKPKQTDVEDSIKMTPDILKPEPVTYKEAEEKYGLVFCDMTLHSVKDFIPNISSYYASNKPDKLYVTRPNIYPMQSITKVAFNPNQDSFLYLATGYQAGFVRISYLEFLNKRRK